MKFYTKPLTSGTLLISASDGAMSLSIQANQSSSCSFIGGIAFKGENSEAITLSDGQGITIAAQSPASPIDGILVTHLSGSIDILVGF